MKISFTLDKNDFLTFQLYTSSKSKRIKKKRKLNKFIIPLNYFGLGMILYYIDSMVMAIIFFLIAILWFLLYPLYERKRYIKRYVKKIEENYRNKFGMVETLEFEDDLINSKDCLGEGKIFLSEAEELNEIRDYYFLKFSSGFSLTIPKKKMDNIEEMDKFMKDLVNRLNIKHNIDLNWKWK
jgi:hypothetical protein